MTQGSRQTESLSVCALGILFFCAVECTNHIAQLAWLYSTKNIKCIAKATAICVYM